MKATIARSFFISAGLFALVLGFQNCGLKNAFTSETLLDISSVAGADPSVAKADIGWSTRTGDAEVDTTNRVSRWMDVNLKGVALYAPVRASGAGLNLDLSGVVTTALGHSYVSLGENASLSPSVSDVADFVSDSYSLVALVRDIAPSPATTLRLFHLAPTTDDNVGDLVVDSWFENGEQVLSVFQYFGASGFASRKIYLKNYDLTKPLGLAIRFDKEASRLHVAVNGVLHAGSVESTVPSVPLLGLAARVFRIHSTNLYGNSGTFKVGEVGLYRRALSEQELVRASASLYARWSGVVVVATPPPNPTATPVGQLSGTDLYNARCLACHGSITATAKRAITLDRLNAGIISEPTMSSLGALSTSERQRIVDALR